MKRNVIVRIAKIDKDGLTADVFIAIEGENGIIDSSTMPNIKLGQTILIPIIDVNIIMDDKPNKDAKNE